MRFRYAARAPGDGVCVYVQQAFGKSWQAEVTIRQVAVTVTQAGIGVALAVVVVGRRTDRG